MFKLFGWFSLIIFDIGLLTACIGGYFNRTSIIDAGLFLALIGFVVGLQTLIIYAGKQAAGIK